MTDRKKVIKGLEQHISYKCETDDTQKEICPYWECEYCINEVMRDALELLKEQEAVKPNFDKAWNSQIAECGVCGTVLFNIGNYKAKYCSECGRKVKWNG